MPECSEIIQLQNDLFRMGDPSVPGKYVLTRYDRCPKVFLSAVALAATVMFWL
jgi:hypothetical protein